MDKSVDLTQGSIFNKLVLFCLPILLGLVFQNLYNSVDSIVIGQFVGASALAAVTICSNINNLLVGFFTGFSTGSSVIFSRYYNLKEDEMFSKAVHTATLFTMLFGIGLAAAAILGAPWILEMMNCPQDVFDGALTYLRIYLIGLLFTGFYNIGSGVLRSVGNSQSPFYYLVFSSVMNIVLDIWFVAFLNWGIAGVGIATVISQGTSALLTLKKLRNPAQPYCLRLKDLKMNPAILKEVLLLGMPAAVQTTITSISNMFIQGYINMFGSNAVAGMGAAMRIDHFAGMSAQSIGLGLTTFVSSNEAVHKPERTKKGIIIGTILDLIVVGATSLALYIYARPCVSIFTTDPEVIEIGVQMLHVILPAYEFMGLVQICGGVLRGYGKSIQVMIATLSGMVVIRQIYVAITLARSNDLFILYRCYPVGWIATVVLTLLYAFFVFGKKKKTELVLEEA
jgi:putative MATE family efflux protein